MIKCPLMIQLLFRPVRIANRSLYITVATQIHDHAHFGAANCNFHGTWKCSITVVTVVKVMVFVTIHTEVRDKDNMTPLQLACVCGNKEVVRYLIEVVKCDVGESS